MHCSFASFLLLSSSLPIRVKLLFRLLERPADRSVPASELLQFAERMVEAAARIIAKRGKEEGGYAICPSSSSLAKGLMQELVFPGEGAKDIVNKE